MKQEITDYAKSRFTAKAYNSNKKIPESDIEKIKELLRFSASSTNAQPWHFIIADNEEGKKRMAKGTERYPFNTDKVLTASHVVLFCHKFFVSARTLAM